jgi:hypothetical protein
MQLLISTTMASRSATPSVPPIRQHATQGGAERRGGLLVVYASELPDRPVLDVFHVELHQRAALHLGGDPAPNWCVAAALSRNTLSSSMCSSGESKAMAATFWRSR